MSKRTRYRKKHTASCILGAVGAIGRAGLRQLPKAAKWTAKNVGVPWAVSEATVAGVRGGQRIARGRPKTKQEVAKEESTYDTTDLAIDLVIPTVGGLFMGGIPGIIVGTLAAEGVKGIRGMFKNKAGQTVVRVPKSQAGKVMNAVKKEKVHVATHGPGVPRPGIKPGIRPRSVPAPSSSGGGGGVDGRSTRDDYKRDSIGRFAGFESRRLAYMGLQQRQKYEMGLVDDPWDVALPIVGWAAAGGWGALTVYLAGKGIKALVGKGRVQVAPEDAAKAKALIEKKGARVGKAAKVRKAIKKRDELADYARSYGGIENVPDKVFRDLKKAQEGVQGHEERQHEKSRSRLDRKYKRDSEGQFAGFEMLNDPGASMGIGNVVRKGLVGAKRALRQKFRETGTRILTPGGTTHQWADSATEHTPSALRAAAHILGSKPSRYVRSTAGEQFKKAARTAGQAAKDVAPYAAIVGGAAGGAALLRKYKRDREGQFAELGLGRKIAVSARRGLRKRFRETGLQSYGRYYPDEYYKRRDVRHQLHGPTRGRSQPVVKYKFPVPGAAMGPTQGKHIAKLVQGTRRGLRKHFTESGFRVKGRHEYNKKVRGFEPDVPGVPRQQKMREYHPYANVEPTRRVNLLKAPGSILKSTISGAGQRIRGIPVPRQMSPQMKKAMLAGSFAAAIAIAHSAWQRYRDQSAERSAD